MKSSYLLIEADVAKNDYKRIRKILNRANKDEYLFVDYFIALTYIENKEYTKAMEHLRLELLREDYNVKSLYEILQLFYNKGKKKYSLEDIIIEFKEKFEYVINNKIEGYEEILVFFNKYRHIIHFTKLDIKDIPDSFILPKYYRNIDFEKAHELIRGANSFSSFKKNEYLLDLFLRNDKIEELNEILEAIFNNCDNEFEDIYQYMKFSILAKEYDNIFKLETKIPKYIINDIEILAIKLVLFSIKRDKDNYIKAKDEAITIIYSEDSQKDEKTPLHKAFYLSNKIKEAIKNRENHKD